MALFDRCVCTTCLYPDSERPHCARSGRSRNTSQICIRGHVHASLDEGASFLRATPRDNWCEQDLALMGNNTVVWIWLAVPKPPGGGGRCSPGPCLMLIVLGAKFVLRERPSAFERSDRGLTLSAARAVDVIYAGNSTAKSMPGIWRLH
jgi:hypothetical protein